MNDMTMQSYMYEEISFDEITFLTSVTPNDASLTIDLVMWVEGLKLLYIHESYGQAN